MLVRRSELSKAWQMHPAITTTCVVMGLRYQTGIPIPHNSIDWVAYLTRQDLEHKLDKHLQWSQPFASMLESVDASSHMPVS